MFERFTEPARQVIILAQGEARTFKHDFIGTEHLLLGLLQQDEGLAADVLEALGVALEEVRTQVANLVGWGDEVVAGQIPFTPRAKKVLELALREALALGHNYIGTEHILLGLVRENSGVAARILLDLGADAEKIRDEVISMSSGDRRGRLRPGRIRIGRQIEFGQARLPGAPWPRRAWEYLSEEWSAGDLETPDRLNERGGEGWSLVGLLPNGDRVRLIFMRGARRGASPASAVDPPSSD